MAKIVFDLNPAAPNIMPSRYGQVSVAAVPSLAPDDLVARFTGREAYFRTRFVVARLDGDPDRCALVELARDGSDELFSPAVAARVLATSEECAYVRDDGADLGIATHMARAALRCPGRRCVVVEGRYRHVCFLLNVEPVRITVVDVVPPEPSKPADQVARGLGCLRACLVDRGIDSYLQRAGPPGEMGAHAEGPRSRPRPTCRSFPRHRRRPSTVSTPGASIRLHWAPRPGGPRTPPSGWCVSSSPACLNTPASTSTTAPP